MARVPEDRRVLGHRAEIQEPPWALESTRLLPRRPQRNALRSRRRSQTFRTSFPERSAEALPKPPPETWSVTCEAVSQVHQKRDERRTPPWSTARPRRVVMTGSQSAGRPDAKSARDIAAEDTGALSSKQQAPRVGGRRRLGSRRTATLRQAFTSSGLHTGDGHASGRGRSPRGAPRARLATPRFSLAGASPERPPLCGSPASREATVAH